MNPRKKTQIKQKWYDRAITFLLYSLVVLIPVVFSPAFYTTFSEPKLLFLRLITLTIILLLGFKVFTEQKFTYKKNKLNVLLILYGAVCILTTICSSSVFTSLFGAHSRFLGLFTIINLLLLPFFIFNYFKDKEAIRKLFILSLITSSLLAIYGILQHFNIWQEQFNWNQNPADRVFGTIGHGNHFGSYLAMNFILGIFVIKEIAVKWGKILLSLGLTLHLVTIFLTASRGAVIALLLALIIIGGSLMISKIRNKEFNYTKWLAPAFVITAILISSVVIFRDDIKKIPLVERTGATIENIAEGKIPDRVSWWLSALEMLKDRPLIGYGLSTYRDIYSQYRRLDYVTLEEGDQEVHITPEAAHNEYLNIAATQGIIGLVSFFAIIFFVFSKIRNKLKKKEKNPYYYSLLGVKGALLVFLFEVFVSFGVVSTLAIFYIYIGAALSLTAEKDQFKHLKLSSLYRSLSALFLLLLIPLAVVGSLREAMAEYYYKSALVKASDYKTEESLRDFEKAIFSQPYEYAYYQAMADFGLMYAQPISAYQTRLNMLLIAVEKYGEAIELNSFHPSLYYNKGIAELQIHMLTGEEQYYISGTDDLETALNKAPNNPLYPYQIAKAYMDLLRPEAKQKAQIYLRKSLQIRPHYRDAEQLLSQIILERSEPRTDL